MVEHHNTKHGHAGRLEKPSPTYNSWQSMKKRCALPSYGAFSSYGAKGVTYCREWESFDNFLADMGERPEGTTLDRIDGNGDYSPDNCRWATLTEQANNRTISRLFEYKGEKYNASELARMSGICEHSMRWRLLRAGWSVARAIATPVRSKKSGVAS